ncbi:hypothetical protein PENTCL1PPCAC_29160, partial [Pristionchus entomophagus]
QISTGPLAVIMPAVHWIARVERNKAQRCGKARVLEKSEILHANEASVSKSDAPAPTRNEEDSKKENDRRRKKRVAMIDESRLVGEKEDSGHEADEEHDSYFDNLPESYHGKDNGVRREHLTFWRSTQRSRCALKKRIVEDPYSYLVQKKLRKCRHKHIKPRSSEGYAPIANDISDIETDDERRDDRCFMNIDDWKRDNEPSEDSRDPVFGGAEAKFARWGHY